MTKIKEILLEIEGKLGYANSTGNIKAEEELVRAQNILKDLESDKDLCNVCENSFESCKCKPTTMIEGRVVNCKSYKIPEENTHEI